MHCLFEGADMARMVQVEPEDDSLAQLAYLGPELSKRNLAYVCLSSLNGDPYYKCGLLTLLSCIYCMLAFGEGV